MVSHEVVNVLLPRDARILTLTRRAWRTGKPRHEGAEAALRRAGVGDAWREHIEVDEALMRPLDATVMVGDATKARRELGWAPTVPFAELVGRMVDHDLHLLGVAPA